MGKVTLSLVRELVWQIISSRDLKWWAVYAGIATVLRSFELLDAWGIFMAFAACAIGGVLAGLRLMEDAPRG